MKRIFFVMLGLSVSLPLWAGDPNSGAAIYANTCAACHGANGVGVAPTFPNLAGQKELYVQTQLQDFQSKSRIGTVMNGIAGSLTPEAIQDVSAFIASMNTCN